MARRATTTLGYVMATDACNFRACLDLCVGPLDRPLLNDTPISNIDLEFAGKASG